MRSTCALLLLAVACGHAPAVPSRSGAAADGGVSQAADPDVAAGELSSEAHALLQSEGQLLWQRWTTGAGPLPASALAEHPALLKRDSLDAVTRAAAKHPESKTLPLLAQQIATLQLSREAGAEIDALERARAQLAFAVDGQDRSERDLDRLLTDEPSAQKRAGIAQAEAKAALPLAPLVLARDAAVEKAIATLGLGSWTAVEERAHGIAPAELAALAEKTLAATEDVAAKAVRSVALRNIGVTADRLRRADLPRLVRSAAADPQFLPGRAWPSVRDLFAGAGVEVPASLRVDAEPSPSKGARPLALLVDPPLDVRLSLRPSGGFEELRATLHEGARAVGGALTARQPWELSQLGDGSAAEGAAQLFEELAGDPDWLRATTQLRGEPLTDLVHTQALRRLLSARRAAALVLFEVRRREGKLDAPAQAALYRGLIQRATFAVLSDDDVARWALEADSSLRGAQPLLGALLGAQLAAQTVGQSSAQPPSQSSAQPASPSSAQPASSAATPAASQSAAQPASSATAPAASQSAAKSWWTSPATGAALRKLWAGGRSLSALDAARALGLTALDPAALAASAAAQLAYVAPEAPPPAPRPDYKYMQGDKKKRRRHRKK